MRVWDVWQASIATSIIHRSYHIWAASTSGITIKWLMFQLNSVVLYTLSAMRCFFLTEKWWNSVICISWSVRKSSELDTYDAADDFFFSYSSKLNFTSSISNWNHCSTYFQRETQYFPTKFTIFKIEEFRYAWMSCNNGNKCSIEKPHKKYKFEVFDHIVPSYGYLYRVSTPKYT